jgi:hypothetical protein
VYKGSISIEGISLTVAKLEGRICTIAIIPHTVEMTNLNSLKPGDPVNLEADLIAKYVEKMMSGARREFAYRGRIGAAGVLVASRGRSAPRQSGGLRQLRDARRMQDGQGLAPFSSAAFAARDMGFAKYPRLPVRMSKSDRGSTFRCASFR